MRDGAGLHAGSRDAAVVRASQVEHTVGRPGSDRHLGCLTPVGLRAQTGTNDAVPARHVGLDERASSWPVALCEVWADAERHREDREREEGGAGDNRAPYSGRTPSSRSMGP